MAGLQQRLMEVKDAARYLGMTEDALRHKAGVDIPSVRIDGKLRFDRRELDRYIDRTASATALKPKDLLRYEPFRAYTQIAKIYGKCVHEGTNERKQTRISNDACERAPNAQTYFH